jgi:hypothetical protein
MNEVSGLKAGGYLTSTVSVILLGIPAFKSAMEHPAMLLCLTSGMGLSVAGMALRWRSHRLEQRQKQARAKAAVEWV